MSIFSSEWKDRVEHWLRTLKDDLYTPLGSIDWECFTTKEYLSLEQAKEGPFQHVPQNYQWGKTWEYGWFRGNVTIPENAAGERIVLNLVPGGEATIFVNNRSFGTYRAGWVTIPHHYVEDNVLTRSAVPGEQFELLVEVYAGHDYPEAPLGGCTTGPVLPGYYDNFGVKEPRRTMGNCTYGIWNEDAYQLYMDADTLYKLLETLDENSLRAANIADALEKFTLVADFEQDRASRIESYKKAREVLRPALEAKNGSTAPQFYGIGNAHIDLPWLWPMQESERKTSRTFAAQLRLLEEYPDYKFIQSQPASYEMCRVHYPELFERIQNAVKAGQWVADGGMWVEPDTNITSGESLIRQLIHGKRYYKEMFDVDSKVLYSGTAPDPQGLRCGLLSHPEDLLVL